MVLHKTGDLLEATEDVIGHQVNCQAVMGAGVALQISKMYLQVYYDYCGHCLTKMGRSLLGDVQIISVSPKKGSYSYVANLFGQLDIGRGCQTDYGALEKSLRTLRDFAEETGLTVALPYKIGCGLAGGDWDKVNQIIESAFDGYTVTLYEMLK